MLRIAKLNVAVERGRMLTFEQSLHLSKRGFRGLTYERSLQLWDPNLLKSPKYISDSQISSRIPFDNARIHER